MIEAILAGGLVFIGLSIYFAGIGIEKRLLDIEYVMMWIRNEIKK